MHPHEPPSTPPTLELEAWLRDLGLVAERVEPLAGDVSPRTYSRLGLVGGSSVILARYPERQLEVFDRFLASGELLAAAGVRVPAVLAADRKGRRMLLEDLGPRSLYQEPPRPWSERLADYRRAASIVARIARLPEAPVAALNPPLDGAALRRELEQTRDLFWRPRAPLPPALERRLESFLDELCAAIDSDPRAPCHRDFMVRNLVAIEEAGGRRLALLDHQDLRLGPATYDLASLLNDSLFPPPEVERAILDGELGGTADERAYLRCAVQRTLKAVGTFAAFAHRGSDRHLPLIPPTLARCLEQLSRLADGAALASDLATAWSNVLEDGREV